MSAITLGTFFSTATRDPNNPWGAPTTTHWAVPTTTSWADEVPDTEPEPETVTVSNGPEVVVRASLPSIGEVGSIAVKRRYEMKMAEKKLDEIVNNNIGAQNRRQAKQAHARQKASLDLIKAEYKYWNAVIAELNKADDYLAVYYEKVRNRGYSKEVRKVLADLKRA